MGVLLFILDMYFLKDSFFALRQVCLEFACAILKFFMFSCVGFFLAVLSMCFFILTALAHSLLNQDLFFLGFVDSFGMLFSVISNSFSVKNSIDLSSMFV